VPTSYSLRNVRSFLEYGEYRGNLYGTSLDAVRAVMKSKQVCVLTPYPQVCLCSNFLIVRFGVLPYWSAPLEPVTSTTLPYTLIDFAVFKINF